MNVLDSFKLDGRVALITGGAGGLGQVIATALAQAGANIASGQPVACQLRGDRNRDCLLNGA